MWSPYDPRGYSLVLYSNYFHLPVVRLVEKLGFQLVQVSGGIAMHLEVTSASGWALPQQCPGVCHHGDNIDRSRRGFAWNARGFVDDYELTLLWWVVLGGED